MYCTLRKHPLAEQILSVGSSLGSRITAIFTVRWTCLGLGPDHSAAVQVGPCCKGLFREHAMPRSDLFFLENAFGLIVPFCKLVLVNGGFNRPGA